MPTYILLLRLTPEGREQMLEDPESVLRAEAALSTPEIQGLGLYGVLGEYDFISIVDAPDNDAVARFSLEFGARAGAQVVTLPAIPVARFADTGRHAPQEMEMGAAPPGPTAALPDEEPDGPGALP